MTVTAPAPVAEPEPAAHEAPRGLVSWITTTDHKRIGIMYAVTSLVFFAIGGILALLMRAELADPQADLLSTQAYNQFFTMHGTIMMFLFATPMAAALANYLVPLHVGAPDMAFPRLNALSYWLFVGGGLVLLSSFLTSRGAPDFGWTGYTPLSNAIYTPGVGADLWIAALALTGIATTITGINVVTTVFSLRAPGMTMFRMPLFTWTMLVQSVLVLLTFPVITATFVMLFIDRNFGAVFFDATEGGVPVLWQHLFWFFGHPEVYIVVLPFFGVISEIVPVFSRKPVFGYTAFVLATLAIAAYSVTTWAHHMFTTGAVESQFFAATTLLIAVPTGVKIFNWVFTMWGGRLWFRTPLLYAISFIVVFLIGGLTGPMLAIPDFDKHVHDTYFVVAHFHYVLLGSAMFAMFAGLYYWWPKVTGWMLRESIGIWQLVLMFVGFNLTFFPQHVLGLEGMPRRYVEYPEESGWQGLNVLSTVGSGILAVGIALFVVNVIVSARRRVPAGDDPWQGNTLEWATSSPPPPHNFDRLPPVRSERPLHDWRTDTVGVDAAREG
ncbi:MAG TPA: cytochrome c oxidase subunit I [Microthrixaceae bacterium]|nr:cytochrome c oxidase subunit I [Microthrixaceae bacterium]